MFNKLCSKTFMEVRTRSKIYTLGMYSNLTNLENFLN